MLLDPSKKWKPGKLPHKPGCSKLFLYIRSSWYGNPSGGGCIGRTSIVGSYRRGKMHIWKMPMRGFLAQLNVTFLVWPFVPAAARCTIVEWITPEATFSCLRTFADPIPQVIFDKQTDNNGGL